jgi:hypothetical protein
MTIVYTIVSYRENTKMVASTPQRRLYLYDIFTLSSSNISSNLEHILANIWWFSHNYAKHI